MDILNLVLNPPSNLTVAEILGISFILGLMHGATPDEHTWPITFSYAIGKYSTKGGMKAGFLFSLGFTLQRALLTTLGFIGLAAIYKEYNLDGPVYFVVGLVMAIAGSYILKGRYVHLPIDRLLHSEHHDPRAERNEIRDPPIKMTIVHGLVAGFGFGAYASIITFVLAPEMPSLLFAPLPGVMFGLGTMSMQIIFGALFANIMKVKKLTEDDIRYVGTKTAGRVLYYGGITFSAVGLFILLFPSIDNWGISTGFVIPNLNAIDVGFLLVVSTVGILGVLSMIMSYREVTKMRVSKEKKIKA
ncbi:MULTISPECIES: hypothetical protein [Metallosphaera]|uniref:Urease accessory protein UreH-like transmembrane domain-containing protein n=1 Tax=Metallosphaera cuprina (strain Ar-4) TaxID=1006006 RepID=F4G1X1_METCR|nr:hypothetical protein [Metallosphaera cuprina]AEB94860.1 conserved hypothetical protein [Metallosphaera cuprina Ar-4]